MADDGDHTYDIPKPTSLAQANQFLSDAHIVLQAQLGRGNTIGVAKIRRVIDSLLEDKWRLAGNVWPPTCHSIPHGETEPCGRVKDTFGTESEGIPVYLCATCDFPHCATGCGRRALALQSVYCHTCLSVAGA